MYVFDGQFCYNQQKYKQERDTRMDQSFMARQGDVLFTKVEQLPEGIERQKSNVIVEGETTGHAHRLVDGRILVGALGAMYLDVVRATRVVHEEHHAITLEPGYYRIQRQREYVAPDIERMVLD